MNTPHFPTPASTHWWSRSRSSSRLHKEKLSEPTTLSCTSSPFQVGRLTPDHPPKPSSMFGTFASAIRLKPKKNVNTAAIQEPPKAPAPLIIPPPNSAEPYGPLTSRPYSKAVSGFTMTDEDSVGPKTPSDSNVPYYKSLLGTDPFAATTGVAFSSPRELQDMDQVFVLPPAHVTEDLPPPPVSPERIRRRPHTANTQSFRDRLVSESASPSPRQTASRPAMTVRWVISPPSHQFSIASSYSHHRTQPDVQNLRPNVRTRKVSMNDLPVSSSAITTSPAPATTPASYGRSKNKVSDEFHPQTRPRGMTETGTRPSLRRDVGRPSLSRPSSSSRSIITPPETSPPSQELPPVPSLKYLSVPPNSDGSPESSSSSLSFASSASESELVSKVAVEDKRLQAVRDQAKVPSEPRTKSPTRVLRGALSSTLPQQPATTDDRPNTLKKMPSQPSLQKKSAGPPSTHSDDQCPGIDDVLGPTKLLKKQRSFHPARGPVPPLPCLKHATSFIPSEVFLSQPMDSPKDKEKERQKEKRESTASPSKRRFLPGSIRRGCTTHAATFTFDEDTGSLIIPPELDRLDGSSPPRFTNPFGSPGVESMILPATSTFYDDLANSPTTGSHFSYSTDTQSQDAGPQQILSTAQLLKFEELLENSESEVSTNSSNRTSPAELGSSTEPSPTDPPPFEEFGFGSRSPQKKNSWTDSIISTSTILSNTLSDKIVFSDKVETGSTLSFFDQQQHPGYRPRTASGNFPSLDSSSPRKRSFSPFASSSQSTISMGIESTFGIEPNQPLGGLTPPPRTRSKVSISTKNIQGFGDWENVAHIQPLSPPPLRRGPPSISSSRSSTVSSTKSPSSTFKNDLPIRGIVKKPSFLDIYDDAEADTRSSTQVMIGGNIHQRSISISSIDDSFLDLGRENNSFDTIRTLSVEGPG